MNQSLGYNTGRGDDITSALLLLIYLLNDLKLPWSEVASGEGQNAIPVKEILRIRTSEQSLNKLFDQTPANLQ